jgi:hypothetical protein
MEQTGCSETLEFKLQTPGNNTKENTRRLKHGESLKPRNQNKLHRTKERGARLKYRYVERHLIQPNVFLQ